MYCMAMLLRADLFDGYTKERASQVALAVMNLPAKAGDPVLVPGLGRSPGGGNGNPPQYSCLGNPTDRETWWATLHGITKSQTQLSN